MILMPGCVRQCSGPPPLSYAPGPCEKPTSCTCEIARYHVQLFVNGMLSVRRGVFLCARTEMPSGLRQPKGKNTHPHFENPGVISPEHESNPSSVVKTYLWIDRSAHGGVLGDVGARRAGAQAKGVGRRRGRLDGCADLRLIRARSRYTHPAPHPSYFLHMSSSNHTRAAGFAFQA